jgi:hypothetical protein
MWAIGAFGPGVLGAAAPTGGEESKPGVTNPPHEQHFYRSGGAQGVLERPVRPGSSTSAISNGC